MTDPPRKPAPSDAGLSFPEPGLKSFSPSFFNVSLVFLSGWDCAASPVQHRRIEAASVADTSRKQGLLMGIISKRQWCAVRAPASIVRRTRKLCKSALGL